MNEYEVMIVDINPCGGEQYAKKEILEVEAESPEAWVLANGRYPILSQEDRANGDVVITTGNADGYIIRYTFSE